MESAIDITQSLCFWGAVVAHHCPAVVSVAFAFAARYRNGAERGAMAFSRVEQLLSSTCRFGLCGALFVACARAAQLIALRSLPIISPRSTTGYILKFTEPLWPAPVVEMLTPEQALR